MINATEIQNNHLMNWLENERGFNFDDHERAEMEKWQQLFLATYQRAEARKKVRDKYKLEKNQLKTAINELTQEKNKLFDDYQMQARINLEILTNRNYEPNENSSLFQQICRENEQLKAVNSELKQQIDQKTAEEAELKAQIAKYRSLERKNVWQISGLKVIVDFYKNQKIQDQTIFLNNIRDKVNRAEAGFNTYEELLASKNQKIASLYQEKSQLEIEHQNCLSELNELETDLRQWEELLADKNSKLAKVIQEKQNLATQLAQEKQNYQTTLNLIQQQQQQQTITNLSSQLTDKEKIIQKQIQRIKELENKPPVIQTKKQEVVKEKKTEVIVDYPVEIEIIQEKDSEDQKREIQKLKQIVQELRTQLAQKSTPINQIIVKDNLPKKAEKEKESLFLFVWFSFVSMAAICLLLWKAVSKSKKGKNKVSLPASKSKM